MYPYCIWKDGASSDLLLDRAIKAADRGVRVRILVDDIHLIGGDHTLMYPDVVAITDVYGKDKVGVIHFDAHFDGNPLLFGHYVGFRR